MNALLRTKSVHQILSEPSDGETHTHGLRRVLGAKDLIALGIGAIIGAGIFATTGEAAAGSAHHPAAGPAVVISYILVAVACGFCALCYAEFASLIPIAGSAYTYAYATLGELAAWIIGWDLILEYAVGNVAVAISWADYFATFIRQLGGSIPKALCTPTAVGFQNHMGLTMNLPAFLIVMFMTALLVRGVRESVTFNNIVVLVKLVVLFLFIGVGAGYVDPANWSDFAPNGWKGIHGAAAIIFFAYIGFDAVSTAAEETENPARNLPIGMIGSLVICTILYILVSLVLTGLASYKNLGTADPMATALELVQMRPGLSAASLSILKQANFVVTLGAVFSLTAVLLVFQMGQPRIFFSMARDGLLPRVFAKVHPTFQTPYVTTILTGVLVAVGASFMDISAVILLCNIGTLFAFVVVCASVLLMRYRDGRGISRVGGAGIGFDADDPGAGPPAYRASAAATLALVPLLLLWAFFSDNPGDRLTVVLCVPLCIWTGLSYWSLPAASARPFNAPFAPLTPILGIVTCVWLMMGSPWETWVRFFVWLFVGCLIYFFYGMKNSVLNSVQPAQEGGVPLS